MASSNNNTSPANPNLYVRYPYYYTRVNRIVLGNDTTVQLADDFFDRLAEKISALADCIKADEDTYKVLESIIALTYTTTGNGYYLYTKGLIEI